MAMIIIVEVEKPITMPSFGEITNKNGMTGNGIYTGGWEMVKHER